MLPGCDLGEARCLSVQFLDSRSASWTDLWDLGVDEDDVVLLLLCDCRSGSVDANWRIKSTRSFFSVHRVVETSLTVR